MAYITKSLSDKLREKSLELEMLDQSKSYDVPYLIIDRDGMESWTLFNTKLNIKHHPLEYHEISEVLNSRIPEDQNLWNNRFYNVSLWEDTAINPLFNKEELWTEKWEKWEIKDRGKLYFGGDFILDIPKLFTIGLIDLNQKMNKVIGFKFYNSQKNISKVIAHYCNSHFSGLFSDGKETVFEEYYFTLFYIDQNGSVFLENNQLEFDPDSCVPFLKIDANGESSWQFYDYRNNFFFGRLFEDHYNLGKEITLSGQSDYFWWTIYTPKYTGHLIELVEWADWTINEEGDLYYDKNIKLNIFDLNLNFTFASGDPIIRFLASDNQISKVIAYCQDGDEDGRIDDWYQTIFYLNRNGKIFLENNNPPCKEVEEMDPWGLIADFEADKDFRDGLFDMI
jgi:hypothetical protein